MSLRALALAPGGLALAAALSITVESAAAQDAASLRVTVRTAATSQPLSGAQIILQGIGIGGTTDRAGVLRLGQLPAGARSVEVRYLGYEGEQAMVMLEDGRIAELVFELEVRPIELAEVRVRPRESPLVSRGFHERRVVSRPEVALEEDDVKPGAVRHGIPGRRGAETRSSPVLRNACSLACRQ